MEEQKKSKVAVKALFILAWVVPAFGLTDTEILGAIELGRPYPNAEQVWQKEFEQSNKVKISSSWSHTGAKVVRVLTDQAKIAMAAADFAREMKPFTVDDARALPDLGRMHIVLRISCRCDMAHIAKRFAANRAHMVLESDEIVVQPEEKRWLGAENNYGAAAWHFLQTGNVVTVQPFPNFAKSNLAYEFFYKEPPVGEFHLVLVGHEGKRFTVKANAKHWR